MKYLLLVAIGLLLSSCSSGELVTIFKDSNFNASNFYNTNIIICPSTGEWIKVGKEATFFSFPEAKLYTKAFTTKLKDLRPCINIVDQYRLSYSVPDLERSMNDRKYCFSNMTKEDSIFFDNLNITFNADYLIFFESVEFFAAGRNYYQVQTSQKESELIIQLWDLKLRKMVYRIKSKGNGSNIALLLKDESSSTALENSFTEYIESLPKCIQQQ